MSFTIAEQRPQVDMRSDLLKAKSRSVNGKVNACPFGCEFKHLDESGYCRHLVGFTDNGKQFEPMVRVKGKRVVRCRTVETEEMAEFDDNGNPVMEKVKVPVLDKVMAGDVLVKISTSYRVYRNIDKTPVVPQQRLDIEKAGDPVELAARQLRGSSPDVPTGALKPEYAVVGE